MKKKYNILIDGLGINEFGGGRSVSLSLLRRVFGIRKNWSFFCFLTQYEQELESPNVKQIIMPLSKGIISRLIAQIIFPFFVIFYQIDLIHFIKSQASIVFFTKKILTIYDCTINKYPEYFSLPSRLFWCYIQPFICRNMDKIITISHKSKSEIIECLKIPEYKINVIYPASQFADKYPKLKSLDAQIKLKYGLNENYFLYIGQIGKKKNLNTIIDAYKLLNNREQNIPKLILVGPRYYLSDDYEIFDKIASLDLNNCIQYLGPIEKEELSVILSNAFMLIFPSVHEGFGIPMIEAMGFGVPVIASNVSVMPEVVKNAGVLVNDFLSPQAWADEILSLYKNPEKIKRLKQEGIIRANDFSWTTSANELITTYESLLTPDIEKSKF